MGPRRVYRSLLVYCMGTIKANVCKSAVMVFSRNPVEGEWKWGEHALPRVSNYTYLHVGIDFACNGAWDVHIQKVWEYLEKMSLHFCDK